MEGPDSMCEKVKLKRNCGAKCTVHFSDRLNTEPCVPTSTVMRQHG